MTVGIVMPGVPVPEHEGVDDAGICLGKVGMSIAGRLVELDVPGERDMVPRGGIEKVRDSSLYVGDPRLVRSIRIHLP